MYLVNYTIERGEVWERLIIPKDRRTHRRRVPTEADATVLIDDTKYVIPTEITYEGGVRLFLSATQTEWFEDGVYPWDMVLKVSRSPYYTASPLAQTLAVSGELTVITHDNITPMDSDGVTDALEEVA